MGVGGWSKAPALAASVMLASSAHAQNLRDVPLGGRTATMGGAAVAAGHDNAMPYLNPAGIAGSPHDVFSISGTVYAYSQTSVRDYYVPNRFNPSLGTDFVITEERLDVEWLTITPSTVAYFYRFETPGVLHVLGLSITTGTYNVLEAEGSFRATSSVATLQQDDFVQADFIQYLAGPSYAVEINRLRLGISALGTYGRLVRDDHRLILISGRQAGIEFPQTINSRQMIDSYSFGLTLVGGAQAQVAPNVWLGAAAELMGLPITGGGSLTQAQDSSVIDPITGLQTAQRVVVRGRFTDFAISRPTRVSVGAGYDRPGTFAAAADVHYTLGNDDFVTWDAEANGTGVGTGVPLVVGPQQVSGREGSSAVFNASIGAELWLTDDLTARAGVFTDLDIAPAEDDDGAPNSRLDWYGVTLGLGSFDGALESTYGIAYRYGDGRISSADVYGSAEPVTVPYVAHGLMLLLSASVRTSEDDTPDKP